MPDDIPPWERVTDLLTPAQRESVRAIPSRKFSEEAPQERTDEQIETTDFIQNRSLPYSSASAVDYIVQANDEAGLNEKLALLQRAERYLQAEIRRQIHAGAHY